MFMCFCLCLWSLNGVFGGDEVKSVSEMEGDSVTLNLDLSEILKEDILWRFGHNTVLIAKLYKNNTDKIYAENADGRFRDRLKLDHQTGSLTITNTRTTDSGLYKVTNGSNATPLNTFNLTVYARLPVPVISSNSSQCSSSSSSSCSLLCSVVNVSRVTLSWYKGNSLLSSISASDLSISFSLPLEVEYQDNNTYSCVINNPISNQATHLDINKLCQPCEDRGLSLFYIMLISVAAAGSLLIVAAVRIFCICRKTDQEGKYYLLLRELKRSLMWCMQELL
ncbi:SLAM family member 5 [Labeo rohita]|uniref:SLAM family member 5 n=1 Tax=Labeo rohita TaxID=84645 RepID=A0ABQ8LJG1_LABRO|nr:SLAM family member 5 [Labeo rohita]